MKKMHVIGLLLVSLALFLIVFVAQWNVDDLPFTDEQQGTAFAESVPSETFVAEKEFERMLTLQERQPIYMKGESLIQIGELEADQPVAIVGEDEAYYEIRLGKMAAFVPKGQGIIEEKKLFPFIHMERFAAVETLQKTVVYEDANLQSGILLQLEESYRYPVVHEEGDWYIIKVGERAGYIHKQSVALDEGLPVLVYHQVLPSALMETTLSTISSESFEQQMDYLADQQFQTLTSHDLYNYLEGRLVVPSKAVIITFDDGLLSTKEYAYPILKQYGFTAPHHIISSRTNRAKGAQILDIEGPFQYLTAADLDELNDVFEFEAHTAELHSLDNRLGFALSRSKDEIVTDLQRNLEQVPGATSIAYPYGHYNEEFIAAAKEVELLIGYTTVEGYANMNDSNYEVNRFGMTEKKSFEQFVTYVDRDMTWP